MRFLSLALLSSTVVLSELAVLEPRRARVHMSDIPESANWTRR